MPWKIVSKMLGMSEGGPMRAAFDQIAQAFGFEGAAPGAPRNRVAFTIAVVTLVAKMSKADGISSEVEAAAFERLFDVPEVERKNLRRVFDLARQDVAGFESYAASIGRMLDAESELKVQVLECLLHVATADGIHHPAEEQFLSRVAEIMGVPCADYKAVRRAFVHDPNSPYEILDVPPAASDSQIKARYRELAREHHPDLLLAKGVPEEFLAASGRRLAAINEAYDAIMAERSAACFIGAGALITGTRPHAFKPDSSLVTRVHPAHNVEERRNGAVPRLVILHYTGMASAEKAIDWLAREESRVSCHYVIDEHGAITQLVPERLRAWHAGVSSWHGETDLNSHSIGIEIQNPGHADGYPDFPARQVDAVIALTRDICERQKIPPQGVLGHSDIAITRKIDPGEKFPWNRLARHGVGLWVKPSPVAQDAGVSEQLPDVSIAEVRARLRTLGYDVAEHGEFDDQLAAVMTAFQRHYRPARCDGKLDRSTLSTLRRLCSALQK